MPKEQGAFIARSIEEHEFINAEKRENQIVFPNSKKSSYFNNNLELVSQGRLYVKIKKGM